MSIMSNVLYAHNLFYLIKHRKSQEHLRNLIRFWTSEIFGCTSDANETGKTFFTSYVVSPVLVTCNS